MIKAIKATLDRVILVTSSPTLLFRCRYGKENVVLSDIWRPTQKILSEGECNFIDVCVGFHCLLDGATVFGVSVSIQIQRHPCIGLMSMC